MTYKKEKLDYNQNDKERFAGKDIRTHNSMREYEAAIKNVSRNTLDSTIVGTPSQLLMGDDQEE